VQKKKIPSLEDRPINFNKKNIFPASSEKKKISSIGVQKK
jgi:hypothetical protein